MGLLVLGGFMAAPAGATAADYAQTALNIIPSGQYGTLPPPAEADDQALMYDGLTPLFDQVTYSDLTQYFKSERFGVSTDGPGTPESVPRVGVTIVRDKYNVPHVTATTYNGGIWAAGWIAAEDRYLLGQQARYNARVAAIDAPGLSALGLISSLQNFQPSARTEAEVAKQTQVLENAGPEGEAVLRDIDTFIDGINDNLEINHPSTAPWTRNDVYALNALKGQFVGEGGGGEARRSQFLAGLQDRLGQYRGKSVFNDLRQFKNPGHPTTIDGTFNYGQIPSRPKGSVILDPGSYQTTPAAETAVPEPALPESGSASNTLMIDADHSRTGYPLMVGGPQIGYFYPGLTYEIDMHAPGLEWRGATSAPFPGYMLIGRGEDFATTLTSSRGDIVDQYVETLCQGSDEKYVFQGKCRQMGHFNAGTLNGDPVQFLTTVHGPVEGYATVNGRKVAISSKRSSYGKDVLDQLLFRRLSTGRVDSPSSFFRAAAKTPQTFNSFYIDHQHVAMYTSGLLPIRPRAVDPGLPTRGTGGYEWQGFLPTGAHMQGVDPADGTMTNWNNTSARGWGSADDWWGGGSVHRVDLLNHNLERLKGNDGKWGLAAVTAAMNAAATQDVRAIDTVPLLQRLLVPAGAPDQRTLQMRSLLIDWRQKGGSRLDKNLDGKIDHPGAAIMDAAWPRIADAFLRPLLGPQLDELDSLFSRYDQPPRGQEDGWHQYFDRDIRKLLRLPVAQPFSQSYCGRGDLGRCRRVIWTALQAAGAELAAEQGTSNPAAWRADATAERITFVPGLLPTTMRYTNRPSGIQQVISFNGHG